MSMRLWVWWAAIAAPSLWLLINGFAIHQAPDRAGLIAALWHHVGVAVLLAPVITAGLVGVLMRGRDAPVASLNTGQISRTVLWALSWSGGLLTAFLVLSGPLVVWTYGSPLKVFDWFQIANPIGKQPAAHDAIEIAHAYGAKALMVIASLIFATMVLRVIRR